MRLVTVYGDESCQNGHNYMVLGTVWDMGGICSEIELVVTDLKRRRQFKKEFHWSGVKGHHIPVYQELIDIFELYYHEESIRFNAMVVDQSDQSHQNFSDNDDELHFYKMFFWLIWGRMDIANDHDILLDRKTNSVPGRLSDLKNALNNKVVKHHGIQWKEGNFLPRNVVRTVEPRDGSQIGLQLADLFAGAIAYVKNGHYHTRKRANPNNPKVKLVDYIQDKLSIDLRYSHYSYQSPAFNIWRFQRSYQRQ
ncbi:DUF3800 domain-containing protein [Halobacillus sp. A1]|uniref:DUF3800 domain-containing protein n=1 Tax=Halobacillus sp. A1 TaxID=2880262 RepID=UPI0020A67481|nr:DUF3800 domain-containing protein [Halobacillus sp. A1]MCP3033444.1 DUF3800 domain-containing protein [Halobacillus sp. A1]